MKLRIKQFLSVCLTILMLVSLVPAFSLSASAAETLTTSVDGLSVTYEVTATASGTSAEWLSNGDTIKGTATGGKLQTSSSLLTFTNNLGSEAKLKFNFTVTNGGTLSGIISGPSGTCDEILADGESATFTYKSPRNATGTLNITGIALISTTAADANLTFNVAENGSYTLNGTAVTSETSMTVTAGTEIALAATPASGYQFYGWYDEINDKYLSQEDSFVLTATVDADIRPVFISTSVALFGVGSAKFDSLTDAGAAAAAGTIKTIVLLNNGTISGEHTIPAGTTLLIPYDDANTEHGANAGCTSSNGNSVAWVSPTAYRTLTLASDAKLTVNGNIEVGGRHAACGGATGKYGGSPTEELGYVNMLAGSHIELNSGANLYCWGYIYGEGTITAKNGANIYENFQIMDFRGGSVTLDLASNFLVFPLSQYYVQNIEVATTYEHGATEYIATSIYMSNQCLTAAVKFIGENAMFQTEEGAYLVKDYEPSEDALKVDAYGDCSLSSLSLELGGTAIDSKDFVLPLTNNIQIGIHNGMTTLKQNIMMLPGSSLTVHEDAVLNLAYTDAEGAVVTAGGYAIQLFDSENWTTALNGDTLETETGLLYCHKAKQFSPLEYTATTKKTRTTADLKDVTLDINGTVITDGFIYSTVFWNDVLNEDFTIVGGGANVISSAKTGKLVMNSGAGYDLMGHMYDQSKASYYIIPLASVQLKNGDGTMVDTSYVEPGTEYSYCDVHDCWYIEGHDDCEFPSEYLITWIVNGTSVSADVLAGETPVYEGEAPAKTADSAKHYTFAGWATSENGTALETLPAVSGEATYYAVFTAESHIDEVKDTDKSHHLCDVCEYILSSHSDTTFDHFCDNCNKKLSDHEFTTYVSNGDATCAVDGTKTATCTICKTAKDTVTDLGSKNNVKHTFTSYVSNGDATCVVDGTKTAICDVCTTAKDTVTDTGSKNNVKHTFTNYVSNGDATCAADGTKTATCDVCNTAKDTVTDTGSKNNVKHTFTTYVANGDATCAADGTKTATCDVCNTAKDTVTDTGSKNNVKHTFTNYVSNNDATFTQDGTKTATCDVCNTATDTITDIGTAFGTGWVNKDGNWYYYDLAADKCVTNIARVPYPTHLGYTPDMETVDSYGSDFIDAETGLFVFDENGVFLMEATGIISYENALRYVENGHLAWNPGAVEVEGEYFYFVGDEALGGNKAAEGNIFIVRQNGVDAFVDGAAYNFANGQLSGIDGIQTISGVKYYFEDSRLMIDNRLTKVEDNFIYVYGSGKLCVNSSVWIPANNYGIVPGLYDFDENGYMINVKTTDKNGIFYEADGYYFYVDGVISYEGLICYTGVADDGTVYENDWIYVRSNGKLATGEYWITKANGNTDMEGNKYAFDETGAMETKTGIFEDNGSLYYYVNGIMQKGLGLIELDGNYYYVRTGGEIVRGRTYWITNVNETGVIAQAYEFDENGIMQNPAFEGEEPVNGIVDGYYYVDGKLAAGAGLVKLEDGSIIYVRSNGQLATGLYWPTTLNDVLPSGMYDFGTDGKLVIS